MPEEMVTKHCSPTLAGMKTGNLFTYIYTSDEALLAELSAWNRRLNSKGIHFLGLRRKGGRALIYVYRKTQLVKELSDKDKLSFLAEYGYPEGTIEDCLDFLCRRFKDYNEFPHEIGVFLGYPLHDIKAFIENKGTNCKCAGCWKVYADECATKNLFARYKRCKEVFRRKQAQGFDIAQLTVAI